MNGYISHWSIKLQLRYITVSCLYLQVSDNLYPFLEEKDTDYPDATDKFSIFML